MMCHFSRNSNSHVVVVDVFIDRLRKHINSESHDVLMVNNLIIAFFNLLTQQR